MAFSRRSRNQLAVCLSVVLAAAAMVCGCSFSTTTPSTPEPQVSPEVTESESSTSESLPSSTVTLTATPTLQPPDQEQTAILRANQTVINGSVQQKLAQVFTVTRSGFISHIALPLDCQEAADLTIRIEDASSGVPGGQILSLQVVPGSELSSMRNGTSGNFTVIAFSNPPAVNAGALYAFVLEAEGGDCGYFWGPPGDTYRGGRAFFQVVDNPPGWREILNPARDLAFQIFISDTAGYE